MLLGNRKAKWKIVWEIVGEREEKTVHVCECVPPNEE